MKILKLAVLALAIVPLTIFMPKTPAHLTTMKAKVKVTEVVSAEEINCLAKNIYMEARSESIKGQIAVALVTLNRVRSPRFHNTICEVVYAYKQFSWTLGKHKSVKEVEAWRTANIVAKGVLNKTLTIPGFKALYYHTRQIRPYWKHSKRVVTRIGNHIFYS